MRCRWVHVLVVAWILSGWSAMVRAQPAETPEATTTAASVMSLAHHAMPGGLHVAAARALPAGEAAVALASSGGYRTGLLAGEHRLLRATGTLAAAFGVTDGLAVGIALDGYYDRHRVFGGTGGCGPGCEDGYVGVPRMLARWVRSTGRFDLGVHAEAWVPGDVAPSFKLGATSLDVRGVGSTRVGETTLTVDAGVRIDNSANSIDDIEALSLADRVSFGISNHHGLRAGVRASYPVHARVELGIESSILVFVGAPPDEMADLESGRLVARVGATAGVRFDARWTGIAFVEATKSPGVLDSQVRAEDIPLVPYEPALAAGLGLVARFGRTAAPRPPGPRACWEAPAGCKTEEQALFGEVSGVIVDENGSPLADATVTVTGKLGGRSVTATTDATGAFSVGGVKLGRRLTTPAKNGPVVVEKLDETSFEIVAELDGREVNRVSVTATGPGKIEAPKIALVPKLPVGQVRGVVRDRRGDAIAEATVSVSPGDLTAKTASDGTFAIDLAPGAYTVSVRAPGFAGQQLSVTIDANGVTVKEFVLQK